MLSCKVDLKKLDDAGLRCGDCKKCLGRSKLDYPFVRDLRNSDDLVKELMRYVEENTGYVCRRTKIDKNPDINVYKDKSCQELLCRIEAKFLEGQAFMKAKTKLGLYPKEALVVDEPKLLSYFQCKDSDRRAGKNIPVFVVWRYDRPCDDVGGIVVFQEIDELRRLHSLYGDSRAFCRRIGENDYQNGARMGVIDKYHYSLRECEPVEALIPMINKIENS